MILLRAIVRYFQIEVDPFETKFYGALLGLTTATMAFGSFVSLGVTNTGLAADERILNDEYILKYADDSKALFKTEDGVDLVTVGSTLSSAGQVVSIEQENGRWRVTTSKHLTFLQH